MSKSPSTLAWAVLTAAASLAIASSAEAGVFNHTRSVQGPNGHGYFADRSAWREPGQVGRSVQRTYNNGAVATGSASAVWGGEAASYQRSHTGVGGNSQTGWGTVYRTDDGYVRSRGASTSNGRSVAATKDVSLTDDAVIVTKDISTGSGATASQTTTYRRGR